jgi:hypothetical protein
MVLRGARAAIRRVKDWAGQAYSTAQDMAPGIRKGAEALRRGYKTAAESGLIDDLAGKHSGKIHRGATRALSEYDRFESVARRADQVGRSMRGD